MNRQAAWILTLVLGAWAVESAPAQVANPPATKKTAPAPAAPMTPAQKAAEDARKAEAYQKAALAMNPILAEWEKRSTQITSLDAVFDKVEISPGFGDQWFRGRALLESPDKACLEFTPYKLDANHKPILELNPKTGKKAAVLEKDPESRIVCTGSEVLKYVWANKTVTIYLLNQQVRQKALQEGPLPFLFNMKAAEAKQRYAMWLVGEDKDHYVIDIAPRMDIDRDSFAQARLYLSKQTFLPNSLTLWKEGGKEREEYKFNGANDMIVANQTMNPKYFKVQKFDGWRTVVNKDGANPPAAGQPAAPGVGQAPAPRQQAAQPGTRTTSPR